MSFGIWQILLIFFPAIPWMGACLAFRDSTKRLHRLSYFGLTVLLYIVSTILSFGIGAAFTSGSYYNSPDVGSIILTLLLWLTAAVTSAYFALARGRDAGFSFQFVLWGWIPIWNIVFFLVLIFSKPKTSGETLTGNRSHNKEPSIPGKDSVLSNITNSEITASNTVETSKYLDITAHYNRENKPLEKGKFTEQKASFQRSNTHKNEVKKTIRKSPPPDQEEAEVPLALEKIDQSNAPVEDLRYLTTSVEATEITSTDSIKTPNVSKNKEYQENKAEDRVRKRSLIIGSVERYIIEQRAREEAPQRVKDATKQHLIQKHEDQGAAILNKEKNANTEPGVQEGLLENQTKNTSKDDKEKFNRLLKFHPPSQQIWQEFQEFIKEIDVLGADFQETYENRMVNSITRSPEAAEAELIAIRHEIKTPLYLFKNPILNKILDIFRDNEQPIQEFVDYISDVGEEEALKHLESTMKIFDITLPQSNKDNMKKFREIWNRKTID